MPPALSRRARRFRASIPATVKPLVGGDRVVCRTRDVSDVGACLDTVAPLSIGTRVSVAMIDPSFGTAIEMIAEVVRESSNQAMPSLGLRFLEPSPDWKTLVATVARHAGAASEKPTRRLRILVVGDDHRQRGAMALYVTSGWDVLFANDRDSVNEAIGHVSLDAVIAEIDPEDDSWRPLMEDARRAQPSARRIVRSAVSAGRLDPLVHRFVDRDAGLEALVDALTADLHPADAPPA
jgi:PilZ domain